MSDASTAMDQAAGEIAVSAGTAGVLGLADVRMDVAPTTAYLMLGGRCVMNCAFCAQARESQAPERNLSRISWPAFPVEQVVPRIAEAHTAGALRRACIQATVTPAAYRASLDFVRAMRAASPIPIDVAILPASMRQVQELIAAGVDHIGFGLDAASQRVFEQVKTGDWERSLEMIRRTAADYPGRAAVHLIVGLGETEREMVEMMDAMRRIGVTVGLFAFTPLRGTPLEDNPPPPISQYRRMQAARFLMAEGHATMADFVFDDAGRLRRILVDGWRELLADGRAWETSGCPDCNRPYYNERPGGTMYNYARRLTLSEADAALQEAGLDDEPTVP